MKYYGITDKGLHRKSNQDSYVIATNVNGDIFAIVADGIGGNKGGDIASRMAVAHFSKEFSETKGFRDLKEARRWIIENVTIANSAIFNFGVENPQLKGMGTTLCGVMITSVGRLVVNIGDSRTYAWTKDNRFVQLTMDHSLVNDMLMHGEITKEEAVNFPKKNVLTNALGVWETVRPDVDVHNEDLSGFMICSDGLHGYVPEELIKTIILHDQLDPALKARRLLKAALDAGGLDNITVVLIDLGGDQA
jgi:protein phosphatase